MTKKPSIWANLLISCLTSILFIGGVELSFRLLFQEEGLRSQKEADLIKDNNLFWLDVFQASPFSVTQRDETLLWRNAKDVQQTLHFFNLAPQSKEQQTYYPLVKWQSSAQGFAATQEVYGKDKAVNEFRILSLGDSSTVGWGMLEPKQSYSRRLETYLNESSKEGKDFKVINTGVIGYTSLQGYRYLNQKGASLKPDLILTYFGNNDASLHGQKSDHEIFAALDQKGQRARAVEKINQAMDRLYAVRFLRKKLKNEHQGRSWDHQNQAIRVPIAQYKENYRKMIAWAKERSTPIVLIKPLTNQLWPTRFFHVDEAQGGMQTYRGWVGKEYPGFGIPIKCLNDEDCVYSLMGPWFVSNLPKEKTKDMSLRNQGASLWQARLDELMGKTQEAKALYQKWLSLTDAKTNREIAIAENNLGVILLNEGQEKEGKTLLRSALKRDPETPFMAYNLGHYLFRNGNETEIKEGKRLLELAMQDDREMVRMHQDYRKAIVAVAQENAVPIIDLDDLVWQGMQTQGQAAFFLDSCHPNAQGHDLIAKALKTKIMGLTKDNYSSLNKQ